MVDTTKVKEVLEKCESETNVKDCHLRNGAVKQRWLGKLDRGDQLSFVAELQLKMADVFGEAVRLVENTLVNVVWIPVT